MRRFEERVAEPRNLVRGKPVPSSANDEVAEIVVPRVLERIDEFFRAVSGLRFDRTPEAPVRSLSSGIREQATDGVADFGVVYVGGTSRFVDGFRFASLHEPYSGIPGSYEVPEFAQGFPDDFHVRRGNSRPLAFEIRLGRRPSDFGNYLLETSDEFFPPVAFPNGSFYLALLVHICGFFEFKGFSEIFLGEYSEMTNFPGVGKAFPVSGFVRT